LEPLRLVLAIFLLCLQAIALRFSIPVVVLLARAAVGAFAIHRHQLNLGIVIGPLIGAAVAIVITAVYRDLREEAKRREQLMAELTRSQQQLAAAERYAGTLAERERLAYDIHDTVAQGLASIVLQRLRSITASSDEIPHDTQHQLDAVMQAAKAALEDTRRVVRALAPAGFAGQSLSVALKRLVSDAAQSASRSDSKSTANRTTCPPAPRSRSYAPPKARWAMQSRAHWPNHAQLTLTYQADQVSLDVADDGRGFDLAARSTESTTGTGIGLIAMRTRLAEVGGTLIVESCTGAGTAISATIPSEHSDV
jgi:signal transduction histidine kinase